MNTARLTLVLLGSLAGATLACSPPPPVMGDVVTGGDAAAMDAPPVTPPADTGAPDVSASDGNAFVTPTLITLRGSVRLEPGEERYVCYLTRWQRAGGIVVRRVNPSGMGAAVHHVGVFTDPLRTARVNQFPCEEMGPWGFVYGGGVGTGALEMPAGTGLPVAENTPLILQGHFVNATAAPVDATVSVDLELAEPGAALEPVGSLFVGTTELNLPPRMRTDVNINCTTHPALDHVFAVFPHMHRLGTSLDITSGAAGATTPMLTLPRWDFGEQGIWGVTPERAVAAGEPINVRCGYNNTTDQAVRFGLHTNDEMCVMAIYYWPARGSGGLSLCSR